MALRYSEGLLSGLRNFGQQPVRQVNQSLAQPVDTSQALAASLGGLFGVDMRSPQAQQQAQLQQQISNIKDPSSYEGMVQLAQAIMPIDPIQGAQLLAKAEESRKASEMEQKKAESQQAFKNSIVSSLKENNQVGMANIVEKTPDLNKLPAEALNRILERAGITDPEDQQKALSPQGKQAADLGYKVGSEEFKEKVNDLVNAENQGVNSEAFSAINSAVSPVVDLSKNQKVKDAVIAISSGGKAGAGALQENTITELFGGKPRAESAVRRFSASASLPRRIVDSVSQWATGEKTELTLEDYEAIIYAAMKTQEESLDTAVFNAAKAVNITDENRVQAIRQIYSYPESIQEWEKRFEEKYKEAKSEKPQEQPDYVSQYLLEARKKNQTGQQPQPPLR